jgi:hypothetical protein
VQRRSVVSKPPHVPHYKEISQQLFEAAGSLLWAPSVRTDDNALGIPSRNSRRIRIRRDAVSDDAICRLLNDEIRPGDGMCTYVEPQLPIRVAEMYQRRQVMLQRQA